MSNAYDIELQRLKTVHSEVAYLTEGGLSLVSLPSFSFPAKEGQMTMDLLLCPSTHSGYSTRLFFEHKLQGKESSRWSQHYVAGRSWWAYSWQGVEATIPWIKMLFAHLEVVK